MNRIAKFALALTGLLALSGVAVACGGDDDDDEPTVAATAAATTAAATATTAAPATPTPKPSGSITVYSGRTEALIKPLIEQFQRDSGITVNVKYGDTTQLAALLIEEGSKSPADVYIAQDAGALGAVGAAGLLDTLPATLLEAVPPTFRAQNNSWVGLSARARVISYNSELVPEADLPKSYKELTNAKWKGQVGWAPTNASFQSFVTAIRRIDGDAAADKWLKDMLANDAKVFTGNLPIVEAVNKGEIKLGLVNHYYLYQLIKTAGDNVKAKNLFTANGDAGSLVNVAGAGMLKSTKNKPAALAMLQYLLAPSGQQYFRAETYEYPVVTGQAADARLKPLADLKPPTLDLSKLDDLQATLALLRSSGVLK
ncbi:MAG: iron ABC transporter substrate-binding protein [Dehalococcoidia bacterium]